MKRGDKATLCMKKTLRTGGSMNEGVYSGEILRYDETEECIYICLESGKLTDLSLDAIYECQIRIEKEQLHCTGRITERYCGIAGKTFKFEIENGFYKINLK